MEFEVPKTYLNAYIIHWYGPTGFAVGEAKEVLWQRNITDFEQTTKWPAI